MSIQVIKHICTISLHMELRKDTFRPDLIIKSDMWINNLAKKAKSEKSLINCIAKCIVLQTYLVRAAK